MLEAVGWRVGGFKLSAGLGDFRLTKPDPYPGASTQFLCGFVMLFTGLPPKKELGQRPYLAAVFGRSCFWEIHNLGYCCQLNPNLKAYTLK